MSDADSDEFNELLLAGLGRFALRGARIIKSISGNRDTAARITPAKIEDFSKALDELDALRNRSEEHTSELQSLMRISYAVSCLKKKMPHKLRLFPTRQNDPAATPSLSSSPCATSPPT